MTSPTSGEPGDAWTGFPAPRADFSEALPGYTLPPGFGARPPDPADRPTPGPDLGFGAGAGGPVYPSPVTGLEPTTWVGHPSGPIPLGSPLDPSTGHEVVDGIVDGVVREVADPFAPGAFAPEPLAPEPLAPEPLIPEPLVPPGSGPPGFGAPGFAAPGSGPPSFEAPGFGSPGFGPPGPTDRTPAAPAAYVGEPSGPVPYQPGGPTVVPAQPDPAGVALPVIHPGVGGAAPIYAPVQRAYGPGPYTRRAPRPPGARPTVSVDNNRCHLYAICQMEAPASFEVGRDGRLRYDMAPPGDRLGEVRQAARLCPMQAIKVRED